MTAPSPGSAAPPVSRGMAILQLAVAILLFGLAWPAIKVGVAEMSPFTFSAWRGGLSALATFVLLGAIGRLRLPSRQDLPLIATVAVFQLTAFFILAHAAVRYVPAGRSSVLAYTTTLWLVPLSYLVGEAPSRLRLLGAGVSLLGVGVLLAPTFGASEGGRALVGQLMLLIGALGWALAILHVRRHRWRLTPFELLPWQFALATVLLTIISLAVEPWAEMTPPYSALAGLLFLGLFAGPLGTWATVSVARAFPPVVSSLALLLTPVVGLVSSAILLGESFTLDLIAGSALILLGLALAALG
ncbi:MAG: DMT family transporter [Alphaproteobacteria bacterium]|nr:DMT family transporter [Alphaproteobacteria bacterium]